jgi:hypothetical protein
MDMNEIKMDEIHHTKNLIQRNFPNELIFGKWLSLKPWFVHSLKLIE